MGVINMYFGDVSSPLPNTLIKETVNFLLEFVECQTPKISPAARNFLAVMIGTMSYDI